MPGGEHDDVEQQSEDRLMRVAQWCVTFMLIGSVMAAVLL